VLACDTTEAIRSDIEHSSLERTFMQLVEEVDVDKVASDIVDAMAAG